VLVELGIVEQRYDAVRRGERKCWTEEAPTARSQTATC
jgi:hypothetical protein